MEYSYHLLKCILWYFIYCLMSIVYVHIAIRHSRKFDSLYYALQDGCASGYYIITTMYIYLTIVNFHRVTEPYLSYYLGNSNLGHEFRGQHHWYNIMLSLGWARLQSNILNCNCFRTDSNHVPKPRSCNNNFDTIISD